MHYSSLLAFRPDHAAALNNLAVAYTRMQMPMHANSQFKKSIERDNTLAAANLATNYVTAGFKEEAKKILDDARLQPDVNPNVANAMSTLSSLEKSESDKKADVDSNSREQQRFLRKFADAFFIPIIDITRFGGMWSYNHDKKLSIELSGDGLIIYGTDTINGRVMFSGQIKNRGAQITTSDNFSIPTASGYVYLSQDNNRMFLMTVKDQTPNFMTLTNETFS